MADNINAEKRAYLGRHLYKEIKTRQMIHNPAILAVMNRATLPLSFARRYCPIGFLSISFIVSDNFMVR
jgi:hypothetical protein